MNKNKIRILLLISESWNDIVHPNNNLTNWFENEGDFDIYTISCGHDLPFNRCCKDYFLLNDISMAKSILPFFRAGSIVRYNEYPQFDNYNLTKLEDNIYRNRNRLHKPIFQIIRELIWRYGKINIKELSSFINNAKPDIVFSVRMGSVKMCSLEYRISKITTAPFVAYTGDNEYFQDGLPNDIFNKIKIIWVRKWLNRMIPRYRLYYCMSKEQMSFYSSKFNINTKFLIKSGNYDISRIHTVVNKPIKILYAGKLYCGRDNTLIILANEIHRINKESIEPKFKLDIYTNDNIEDSKLSLLNNQKDTTLKKAVSSKELLELYKKYDIILHVEALDSYNSILTKYSFSTKIVDCMSSGCCVMAICNQAQSGFSYLKENGIALTASDNNSISKVLNRITKNPNIVIEYAKKIYEFGVNNNSKEIIHDYIMRDFKKIIYENSSN